MGFVKFLNNLINKKTKNDSCEEYIEGDKYNSKVNDKQDTSQDMDDLDFDEMNDVWDEFDD